MIPALPARVLAGGRRLPGWRLRDECVTRLLFESGGRVSEITGLTLADWVARGMLQEATTFSKGSRGVRVKFLRFLQRHGGSCSAATSTPSDRPSTRAISRVRISSGADPRHPADVLSAPVFLTARRTPLAAKNYRERAWNPACAAAGIDADVHQARHWYVTMAVRQIYETATTDGAVQRRLRELIEYMKWRRGGQNASRPTSTISMPSGMPRSRTACTRVWTRRCGRRWRPTPAGPRSRPPAPRPSPPNRDWTSPSGRTSNRVGERPRAPGGPDPALAAPRREDRPRGPPGPQDGRGCLHAW